MTTKLLCYLSALIAGISMEIMSSFFNSLTFVLIVPVHLQRELAAVLTLQ